MMKRFWYISFQNKKRGQVFFPKKWGHIIETFLFENLHTWNARICMIWKSSKTEARIRSKGPVKIYRVPRPGFGKNLPEKSLSPPFFSCKKLFAPLFLVVKIFKTLVVLGTLHFCSRACPFFLFRFLLVYFLYIILY